MLKTTRTKEKKQTKPSKTLVPIIRNRINLARLDLLGRKPYSADIRPCEQKSAYIFKVAICNATRFKRVSDALRLSFSQTQLYASKSRSQFQAITVWRFQSAEMMCVARNQMLI